MTRKKYHAIPTNIITGFLGAGKTTVIRHLLNTKPANERWAVLVNEFGEVGIDGAFLNAEGMNTDGIAVKEVPGGCMCCSVGLPSRTALNNLIRTHNPDRILIEPTGLAHPAQVLAMFSGKEYEEVLDLRAVVCLVDPWCISEPQFLALPAFHDQIAMADLLVATKQDIAEQQHLSAFENFAEQLQPAKAAVEMIAQGELPWQQLNIKRAQSTAAVVHYHDHSSHLPDTTPEPDADGVIQIESSTAHSDEEQTVGCGWIFPAHWQFDPDKLTALIKRLTVPRIKGVFATPQGWYAINKMRQTVSSEILETANESRIEMINLEPIDWAPLDKQLRSCRSNAGVEQ